MLAVYVARLAKPGTCTPMVVESFEGNDGSMMVKKEAVVIGKLIDCPLLLPMLSPLLPDSVLIVDVLHEPQRPLGPFN